MFVVDRSVENILTPHPIFDFQEVYEFKGHMLVMDEELIVMANKITDDFTFIISNGLKNRSILTNFTCLAADEEMAQLYNIPIYEYNQ